MDDQNETDDSKNTATPQAAPQATPQAAQQTEQKEQKEQKQPEPEPPTPAQAEMIGDDDTGPVPGSLEHAHVRIDELEKVVAWLKAQLRGVTH